MNAALELILSRVEGAREVAPGRWRARCPAHGGHNRNTLAVSEGDDGRVLMHCFAGCEVSRVVAAIGLELHDLMPPRPDTPSGGGGRMRNPFMPAQVFEALRFEAQVLTVIAHDVDRAAEAGTFLPAESRERLNVLRRRVDDIAKGAYGGHRR
jgi:hypothetical protein